MYLLDNDDKESTRPMRKRDHRAERNPHYGHAMQSASKDAIAKSQKARYEFYKKAAANIMTEDKVREIITETIRDYLANNVQETKNKKRNNIPL